MIVIPMENLIVGISSVLGSSCSPPLTMTVTNVLIILSTMKHGPSLFGRGYSGRKRMLVREKRRSNKLTGQHLLLWVSFIQGNTVSKEEMFPKHGRNDCPVNDPGPAMVRSIGSAPIEVQELDMRSEKRCFRSKQNWKAKEFSFYYPPGTLGEEMRELERRFLSKDDWKELVAKHLPASRNGSDKEFFKSPLAKKQRLTGPLFSKSPTMNQGQHVDFHKPTKLDLVLSQSKLTQKTSNAVRVRGVAAPPVFNGGKGFTIPVAEPADRDSLTLYQALIRASLEYFTSVDEDVNTSVQGRRQAITHNQLGVRCIYCRHLPIKARSKAAVYYPKTIMSLYQGAQNVASVHFPVCSEFPPHILKALEVERTRRNVDKAGRPYWAEKCRRVGIYEADSALWLSCEESKNANVKLHRGINTSGLVWKR